MARNVPAWPVKEREVLFEQIIDRICGGESACSILDNQNPPIWRGHFWHWLITKAGPKLRLKYANAQKARAHALVDSTIAIADAAKDRDQALCAKIQIEARWRAAMKFDPEAFGEAPRSMAPTQVNVALISAEKLKEIQERHEYLLTNGDK